MLNTVMSKEFDFYISEFSKTFPQEFCNELIDAREQEEMPPYKDLVYWTHKDLNNHWQKFVTKIDNFLKTPINEYLGRFESNLSHDDVEIIGFGLMKQPAGTYDIQHFDTPIVMNEDTSHYRPFVCLVYLNGEELEGGQLIFPSQKRIISPEKGKALLFPCSYMYPHRVATIGKGERVFLRINYKFTSKELFDFDLDNWDITKDGVQRS